MSVSEKTLELNITTELVSQFRNRGYQTTTFGLTLQQELIEGYDSSIYVNNYYAILIQYKAGRYRPTRRYYTFYINNNSTRDQHTRLLSNNSLSANAYYAFPLITTPMDVIRYSGSIIERTVFVPSNWIGILNPPNRAPRITIDESTLTPIVHNQHKKLEYLKGEKFIDYIIQKEKITLHELIDIIKSLEISKFSRAHMRIICFGFNGGIEDAKTRIF